MDKCSLERKEKEGFRKNRRRDLQIVNFPAAKGPSHYPLGKRLESVFLTWNEPGRFCVRYDVHLAKYEHYNPQSS